MKEERKTKREREVGREKERTAGAALLQSQASGGLIRRTAMNFRPAWETASSESPRAAGLHSEILPQKQQEKKITKTNMKWWMHTNKSLFKLAIKKFIILSSCICSPNLKYVRLGFLGTRAEGNSHSHFELTLLALSALDLCSLSLTLNHNQRFEFESKSQWRI